MRIVIDLTALADNFSGMERYALCVTQELIKSDQHRFILLFKNEIYPEFKTEKDNIEIIILNGENKLIFNQIILPKKLRKIKADRYLFMVFPSPIFFHHSGIVNTIHDVSCWDQPETNKRHMIIYWRVVFRIVAMGKSKIMTVSNFSKNRIKSILHINDNRITVTYSAPSKLLLEEKNVKAENMQNVIKKYDLPEQYFLCLSTLEPRKNLRLLIEAYKELVESGDIEYPLVLAGRKGWMVDNLLEELPENVKKQIIFTGFIEEKDLPIIYKCAILFVFPSLYEGFGVPPLEAMLQRTLVLSSDAASLPEVLGDGVLYFKSNDKESLRQGILTAIKMNTQKKVELLDKGYEIAKKYNWIDVSNAVKYAIGNF